MQAIGPRKPRVPYEKRWIGSGLYRYSPGTEKAMHDYTNQPGDKRSTKTPT